MSDKKVSEQVIGATALMGFALIVVASVLAVLGIWVDGRWGATAWVPGILGAALIVVAVVAA